MTERLIFLPEDWVGDKPSNLIVNEVHSPVPGKLRLVLPNFGAFYKESLVVKDAITGDLVTTGIIMGDPYVPAHSLSGKDAYTCFLLDETAPTAVSITYQGVGGVQSRNALEIAQWLHERIQSRTGTLRFSELLDFPYAVEPKDHQHLLSHVFGLEYVTNQLGRLKEQLASAPVGYLEECYTKAKVYLEQTLLRSKTTVEGIVASAWRDFEKEMSLFNLGIDLLRNHSPLGDVGVLAADPRFTHDEIDERYVDLYGLGAFSKELVKHILHTQTGIDLTFSELREPIRGSFIGAAIGETFVLPSPRKAKSFAYASPKIYPPDFPADSDMIVVKTIANRSNLGGVFNAFCQETQEQWIGLLQNDRFNDPIVWNKVYFDSDGAPAVDAMLAHQSARGAVHEETKAQLGLAFVENLPVISPEEIITRESKRKYLTYDALMAYWRAHMESIKLERKANGEVDYDADLMDKTRVVIGGTGACSIHPSKDQFISSFCDGSDKYVRMSDGNGGYYDKLQQSNSPDCNFSIKPEYGKELSQFCQGANLVARYADGLGGSFTEVIKVNSTDCGYRQPPAHGAILSVFCQGVNQITRYADGTGGTYDMVSMVDTYLCGGSIYPSKDGGGSDGGGGTTPEPSSGGLVLQSSHSRISPGTVELLQFVAYSLNPLTTYQFEIVVKSPAISSGSETVLERGTITTDDKGACRWSQERIDVATTTQRGVYDTWVRIASINLVSNHINRAFIEADVVQPPEITDKPVNPDEPPDQTPPPKVIEDDGIWPPVSDFDPKVYLESTHNAIFLGDHEVLKASLTGFMSQQPYELQFWTSHPKINNGSPTKMLSVTVTPEGRTGATSYSVNNYDDGTVPRGMTTDWVEVVKAGALVAKSASITRLFSEGTRGSGNTYPTLKTVCSHSLVYKNTSYSVTVALTGGKPNTVYIFNLYRSRYSGTPEESQIIRGTAQVTTDGVGTAKYDFQFQYNGTGDEVTNISYNFFSRLSGESLMSTLGPITYSDKAGQITNRAILSYKSTLTTVYPGVPETITATLTDGEANKTYNLQHWIVNPGVNSGQPLLTHESTLTTNGSGTGVYSITVQDDGKLIPRGNYECYALIPEIMLKSSPITRIFAASTTTTTPAPATPMTLGFDTSSAEFKTGTAVVCRADIAGGKPNTTYTVKLYASGDALKNGNTPVQIASQNVTTNSSGSASQNWNYTDNGTTLPRGTYVTWLQIDSVKSNTLVRQFVASVTAANPRIALTLSKTTIYPGDAVTYTIKLTGFPPNASFTIRGYMRGSPIFNRTQELNTFSVTTNAAGDGNHTYVAPPDSGPDTIPRGTYALWMACLENSVSSPEVSCTWMATPTQPPAAKPKLTYSSNLYTVKPGVTETHTVSITGGRPNKSYRVSFYIQSSALNNYTPLNTHNVDITTNSSGNVTHTFNTVDNGTAVPRGTYSNWAVIASEDVSSSTFTRVFAPADPKVGTVTLTSSLSTLYYGDLEYFNTFLKGWDPYTTYTIEGWVNTTVLGPPYNRCLETFTITTDAFGNGQYLRQIVAGPAVPVGVYSSWMREVSRGVDSPPILRVFAGYR